MSEGIDFRDNKGRIAIITGKSFCQLLCECVYGANRLTPSGIPLAPHMDPWVVLKRMHLDDSCRSKGAVIQPHQAQQAQAHVQRIMAGMSGQSYTGSSGAVMAKAPVAPSGPAATSAANGKVRRLTGQAWYDQSASRAVNQVPAAGNRSYV